MLEGDVLGYAKDNSKIMLKFSGGSSRSFDMARGVMMLRWMLNRRKEMTEKA
jgi:hypothetical protein